MKRYHLLQVCFALPFIFVPFAGKTQNNNANPNAQGNGQWKTDGNLADPSHFIGTVNDRAVIFKSNNAERFRLTPDGKVGIGTSTPATTLDVNGNTTLRNDVFMPGIGLALPGDDILFIDPTGQVKKGDGGTLGNLIYEDKGCVTGVISNPTWSHGPNKIYSRCPQVFVGIATDAPAYSLDVRGNAHVQSNMGIGTAPSTFSRLHIDGTNFGSAVELTHNGTNFSKLLLMKFSDPSTELIKVENTQTNTVPFLLEGTGKMTIHNGTEKILQLEPNGLLRSRQIRIDLDNWADYVFEDDYPLMPLKEVAEYIEKAHHLPNIPSEAELKESGMDVAVMNRLLMEKVEELTLYMIQLEAQNAAQQAQINALLDKND